MMVAIQFLPGADKKQQQALSLLHTVMQNSQTTNSNNEGSYDFRHGEALNSVKSELNTIANTVKKSNEPETVVINGKIYPKSPNNIYEIDGERIMYKQRTAQEEQAALEETARKTASESPAEVEISTNPLELMKNLETVKAQMRERNQVLKDVMQ